MHGLRRDNIVDAVLRDLVPAGLWYGLVPRNAELLVVDTELDLPLLEGHLCVRIVIHVRVGDGIRVCERRVRRVAD